MKNNREKNIRKRKTPQKRSFWLTFIKNQKKIYILSIIISIIKPLFDMLMELIKLFSN